MTAKTILIIFANSKNEGDKQILDENMSYRTCMLNDSCTDECEWKYCHLYNQLFFLKLMGEASDVAGCFNTRVRHLLHLHVAGGIELRDT